MDAKGHSDNGLEQLLWAFELGKWVEREAGAVAGLTMKEASAVYTAVGSGAQPRHDELRKWVHQLADGALAQIIDRFQKRLLADARELPPPPAPRKHKRS